MSRRGIGQRGATSLLVLGGLLLVLLHPGLAVSAAPEPARMVLQLQDLPRGFAATKRRDRPNGAVASETGVGLATLRRWGRLGGHEAVYDRMVDPRTPPRGAASVVSVVSTYRSGSGLGRAFAASVKRIEDDRVARHVERSAPSGLGTTARMWVTRFDQDGVPVVLYTVLWRSRGALAFLSVAGVEGRLQVADAAALARRQQQRMRAAGATGGPRLVAGRLYTAGVLGR